MYCNAFYTALPSAVGAVGLQSFGWAKSTGSKVHSLPPPLASQEEPSHPACAAALGAEGARSASRGGGKVKAKVEEL